MSEDEFSSSDQLILTGGLALVVIFLVFFLFTVGSKLHAPLPLDSDELGNASCDELIGSFERCTWLDARLRTNETFTVVSCEDRHRVELIKRCNLR